jgi:hypothetical protein
MARVIPVVGSGPGGLGSLFKTEMQFFNPQTSGMITCELVFHAAGVAGASTDTTVPFTLDPGEIFSASDIVAGMGLTGFGSLDVWVPAEQSVPLIVTRVYNDADTAGSSGLTEDAIPSSDSGGIGAVVLGRGVTGFLVTPREPTKTRFNIGVRTLYSGAVISVTVRNAAGVVTHTTTKTYTANYFVQTDAASFLGVPINGNESIQISISSGSAIVYGSTTDNVTNDPAIQFVTALYAIE